MVAVLFIVVWYITTVNKCIGSQLLNHVIKTSRELGAKRLWCNARLNATNLYERHGLKKTDQTFEKGGQLYVIMEILF